MSAPDYAAMQPGEMLKALGTDAQKWADCFCQLNPSADHGLMVTWFSNAIMAGYDLMRGTPREAKTGFAPPRRH